MRPDRTALIHGSGVDPAVFCAAPEPPGPPIVLISSRVIWAKGIAEFAAAARLLRAAGIEARFVIVGEPPVHNRSAVPAATLEAWQAEGVLEWWGHRRDMAQVYAQSSIVCLPSFYREGVPKALIEAASCGRPIVTTDMPGCREICRHGINGLCVPPRDVAALVAAIAALLADPARRRRMGAAGRALVEAQFSLAGVVRRTLDIYRDLGAVGAASASAGLGGLRPHGALGSLPD